LINSGVSELSSHGNNNQTHLNLSIWPIIADRKQELLKFRR